jgi:predicted Ser/Thr protein kinase
MIGKTIGNLRIIAKLGEGGMGELYLAENIALQNRFAVKRLLPELTRNPEFRELFYQEAKHQALLNHPNIVPAIDYLEEDGQFFFIMAYVKGQDLSKLIKTKDKLSEKEALSIFKDVLEGLKFAHDKGIIHRDIKPSNILIDDESGIARITDFGIAILAGERQLTATGNVFGSPWYMSPEQIIHPRDIDRRSDIYSAGIVLYEMLTGDVPFDGETDHIIKDQQINSPVPNLRDKNSEISSQVAQMILKAMAKKPGKRFQDCAEFLKCIEAYEIEQHHIPPWFFILLWSFVAIALLGIGAVIIYEVNTGRIPQEDGKLRIIQEHEFASNWIQGASEKAVIICGEFEEIKNKQQALEAAEIIRNPKYAETIDDLEKTIEKEIQEKDQNIRDGISGYNDFIAKLGGLTKAIVDEEFDKYFSPLQGESSGRAQFTRLVKLHYDNKRKVDVEIMRKACMGVDNL